MARAYSVKCCCCDYLVLAIVNSNSALDDDFRIYLNGVDIGTINNSSNACTGRLWSTNTDIDTYTGSGFCQTSLEATLELDTDLLVEGENDLMIETTLANGNGNFGVIVLDCVSGSAGSFKRVRRSASIQQTTNDGGIPAAGTYSFGNHAAGFQVEFTFTWDGEGHE